VETAKSHVLTKGPALTNLGATQVRRSRPTKLLLHLSQARTVGAQGFREVMDEIDGMEFVEKVIATRNGGALALDVLPKMFTPNDVAYVGLGQMLWQETGLRLIAHGRTHEALPVFYKLYDHMLSYQDSTGNHIHKGMPLVWMSDCHYRLGHPALGKRYLMLTACEDAIRDQGTIPPETSGVYFRLVWERGLPDRQLQRYADEIWKHFQKSPQFERYPESILLELDQQWMTEYPSAEEGAYYIINSRYVKTLLCKLGAGDGLALERLAQYLLSSMPGCRTYRRKRTRSTDYDVICTLEGLSLDFRSELGRYFLCECKDWAKPVDFNAFTKFAGVLRSAKCKFGVLFSDRGITGQGRTSDAEREQLKIHQEAGTVVVVVSRADLDRVADGENFITMLRTKYEEIRLDLRR
jgi:hypothetical protein